MSDEASLAAPAVPPAVAADAPQPPSVETEVVDRLMKMADHCLRERLLRQAAEMYFHVLSRRGAGDQEMEYARRRLMEIAEHYERMGKPHQARGIYEQLL